MSNSFELDLSLRRRVPVILQSEVAECGLACLAMVLSYFGQKVDIRSLRTRFDVSMRGLGLKHLLSYADRCGLNNRAIRCELSELHHLKLPAVLHWDLNHYVVLVKVSGDVCWLHDPAMGKVRLSISECGRRFTGVAVELSPGMKFEKGKQTQRLPLRQFWQNTSRLGQSLSLLLALSALIQLTAIVGPYYMQWVIDHALLTYDSDLLLVLALGFTLVMLFGALLSSLRSWLVLRLASTLNLNLGVGLLRHLLRLPMDFFQKRHVGDIVSRFSSLGQIRERLTTGVVETLVDGLMSLMMLTIMLFYSVTLTLVVLGAAALYIVVRALSYGPLYRLNEKAVQAGAVEQTNFLESVRAIQSIKLFGRESHRISLWQNHYTEVINSDVRLGKLNIAFGLCSSLVFGMENILVIYLAAQEVLAGFMSVGMMLAFMAYKTQLSGRLTSLVEQWIAFRMMALHLDRVADIALAHREPEGQQVRTVRQGPSALRCEKICFQYDESEGPVLADVSFQIPAGSFVAILGPSGEGKSTLLKLLQGLLQPNAGRIFRDDFDVARVGLNEYRRENSAVSQDDQLLAGSVADNISFFDLAPDAERIDACADIAGIRDQIAKLPMGYESLVGDLGSQFSGGQVQRLLFARAIYQNPRVLFLDEATSHLDKASAQHITNAVQRSDMTRVVVAHDMDTVRGADQILHVQEGRVSAFSPEAYFSQQRET